MNSLTNPFLIGTIALSLLATPILADESEHTKGGILTISGTGKVDMAPDMALISAGVQSRAKTAENALADNNAKMQALFAALETAGIEKKDIQTSNFSIHPDIIYPKATQKNPAQAPRIVGYVVNNQVGVKIRKLNAIGSVLTALVEAGANAMSGLSFDVSNKKSLMEQARKAALDDARSKATLYATELGTSVKRLIALSEGGGYRPPAPVMLRAAKSEMMSADVPVSEGTMSMTITISTSWELVKQP